jgi:hypothetical protein
MGPVALCPLFARIVVEPVIGVTAPHAYDSSDGAAQCEESERPQL